MLSHANDSCSVFQQYFLSLLYYTYIHSLLFFTFFYSILSSLTYSFILSFTPLLSYTFLPSHDRYCSLELIISDDGQPLDLRYADMFSLGASVYELCLGRELGGWVGVLCLSCVLQARQAGIRNRLIQYMFVRSICYFIVCLFLACAHVCMHACVYECSCIRLSNLGAVFKLFFLFNIPLHIFSFPHFYYYCYYYLSYYNLLESLWSRIRRLEGMAFYTVGIDHHPFLIFILYS